MLIYDYNNPLHKFKALHDETGGKLKEFSFQYEDCFCGTADYRIVSTATRHRNPFTIVQCSGCGTLRINPYLSDASIEHYYKEVYGPVKRGDMPAEKLFTNQEKSSAELCDDLRPYLQKNTKLLDYGSGAGGRMAAFLAAGYEVYLQDYDRNYLEYGLKKGMKEFSEKLHYDVIILSHVLEHISHPQAFITKLGSYLTERGMIYIEVPMIENNSTLLADFQLAHKFYFTSESLAYLVGLAGFKVIASFHNALLITAQPADINGLAEIAKKKSDTLLQRSLWETRLLTLRMAIKRFFAK